MNAHYFNPTCEMEVANGKLSYMPPAHLLCFSEDLACLPCVYAEAEDVVLVKELPPLSYCASLQKAGFILPNFHLLSEVAELSNYTPRPWGWSPSVAYKLRSLGAEWNANLRPFFSREFALEILQKVQNENLPTILDSSQNPIFVTTFAEVEAKLEECGKIVTKAPFSSSGRGVEILDKSLPNEDVYNKIRRVISQQGGVMEEPFFDVLCNFAYEFQIINGQVQFLGYSSFETNEKGQYLGQHLPFSLENFSPEVASLFESGIVKSSLGALCKSLKNSDLVKNYEGYFGVDAFAFRDAEGKVRLQPCVEINLRTTMGIVALHLEKRLAKGSQGIFKIGNQPTKSLQNMNAELAKKYPLSVENGKIVSGYLPLTPLLADTQSLAYLVVSEHALREIFNFEVIL